MKKIILLLFCLTASVYAQASTLQEKTIEPSAPSAFNPDYASIHATAFEVPTTSETVQLAELQARTAEAYARTAEAQADANKHRAPTCCESLMSPINCLICIPATFCCAAIACIGVCAVAGSNRESIYARIVRGE